MAQDINNLIWIDMEMSGLSPQTDRILEVALVITDSELDIIAEAPVLVISPVGISAGRHGQLEQIYPCKIRPDRQGEIIS